MFLSKVPNDSSNDDIKSLATPHLGGRGAHVLIPLKLINDVDFEKLHLE